MTSRIFHLAARWNGKYYATFAVLDLNERSKPPQVSICGPFDTEHEVAEFFDGAGQFQVIQSSDLPSGVQQGITDSLLRGWRRGELNEPHLGTTFGETLQ